MHIVIKSIVVAVLLNFSFLSTLSYGQVDKNQNILNDITKMYMASMTLIFKSQPLINQRGGDKAVLFGDDFINNIKITYREKYSDEFPELSHFLKKMLLQAMVEVMEDNRVLFNDDEIGFKGIIPAIFAAQLAAKLSTKGVGLKIKFTRTKDDIRNVMNLPDEWEEMVMQKVINKPAVYFDNNGMLDGNPAYRQFTPLPMVANCLKCHGSMVDNPLNFGKDRSQWTNIDMTGFEMENWTLSDFGGGVSLSIEKSVLE